MLIEYVGHACFYIVSEEGTRVIIDPYDNSIGLAPVKKEADIVLITHHHFDHDYFAGVSGEYTMMDKAGEQEICGVSIRGRELPHDDANGSKRGMVVAYSIKMDGMRILHMGDVGAMPDDAFFDWAGKVDILMLPIGGTYTVDAEGAVAIMDRINANIIIPMHYKTTHLTLDIESPHHFTKLAKKNYDVSHLGSSKFEITADRLKKRRRVILMENSF
ncbi:MBL fold metallo-hydrolase [Christensenellaceae bacterium OttesenSCG-928-K19]|nr:MBL fold metallo-hydrolase [Christensenellaceae bacterium OttesenSCG-928-K19]